MFSGENYAPGNYDSVPTYDQVSGIADSVSGIEKSVSMMDEDLQSLVDIAARRYVNNINLTSQAPVINITGQNTGNMAISTYVYPYRRYQESIKTAIYAAATAQEVRAIVIDYSGVEVTI